MDMSTIVLLVIAVVLALGIITIYNRLTVLRNRFLNAFAQIDVQMKRRHDLIPNLVETAQRYLAHERDTLEAVVNARNDASAGLKAAAADPANPNAMDALASAETALGRALGQFNVVVEAYPDLKADQTMQQLSEELTSTENRVAFARQAYNDQVMVYNGFRQSFPPVAIAGVVGHRSDAMLLQFEDQAEIQQAPRVSFST